MSILSIQNVSYVRDNKTILDNISLSFEEGEFVAITSPSGSGKSTFLKLCSSLISPTAGTVSFYGRTFTDYEPVTLRRHISYCFQTPCLFGDTVMDNLVFPYRIRHQKPDIPRIHSLFSRFQMSSDYLTKEHWTLSGGERQRIALIRSMLFMPKILLLDEVTSALDQENASIVKNVIRSVNREGTTFLWVTHQPERCRVYADKLLTFQAGKFQSAKEQYVEDKNRRKQI